MLLKKLLNLYDCLKLVLTIYLDHDCDKSIHSNVNQIIYKDAVFQNLTFTILKLALNLHINNFQIENNNNRQ